jgi:hypothetical protein
MEVHEFDGSFQGGDDVPCDRSSRTNAAIHLSGSCTTVDWATGVLVMWLGEHLSHHTLPGVHHPSGIGTGGPMTQGVGVGGASTC